MFVINEHNMYTFTWNIFKLEIARRVNHLRVQPKPKSKKA